MDGPTRRRPDLKRKMTFGTWNIKTITGKEVELTQEMKDHRVDVLGVSEVKKKRIGAMALQSTREWEETKEPKNTWA